MPQLDLTGKPKRRKIRYGQLYSRGGQSSAESAIEGWLASKKIFFDRHALIGSAEGLDSAAVVRGELERHGKGNEAFKIVSEKLDISRAVNNARCDFKVEGMDPSNQNMETYFIEYWGLCNPKIEVSKKAMRKMHSRLVVLYTFVKKPIKEEIYSRNGLKLVSLFRPDLKRLDEKLGFLEKLEQPQKPLSRFL